LTYIEISHTMSPEKNGILAESATYLLHIPYWPPSLFVSTCVHRGHAYYFRLLKELVELTLYLRGCIRHPLVSVKVILPKTCRQALFRFRNGRYFRLSKLTQYWPLFVNFPLMGRIICLVADNANAVVMTTIGNSIHSRGSDSFV
jgi:hypothetical protein